MMRRLGRWVIRILLALMLLILIAGTGGYFWLQGGLPQTSGTIRVQGITAPVQIVRDSNAIPHIRAANEADALFGLGYAHAQDRLWQMEFQRRIGNGRLSEVLGAAARNTDKFLRTLGVARAAASAWETTAPETRALVEAYVAGVNSFILSHHGRELPPEFSVLGFEPEPWRPEDVLVWGKMLAWNLAGNRVDELLRARLQAHLSPDQVAALMPASLGGGPIILPQNTATSKGRPPTIAPAPMNIGQYRNERVHLPDRNLYPPVSGGSQLLAIERTLRATLGLGGTAIGSNSWVLSGAHTTTGKPLLANDPHLDAQMPSLWYLAQVTGGTLNAIGATLPGIPGIIIGHNARIAWGDTNAEADVQDLYVEHINDRDEVEYQGTWTPMRIVTEVIKVKGEPDTILKVRLTRHGPLISDVTTDSTQPMALRWAALDDQDPTITAILDLNRAGNWSEFTKSLSEYHVPMQSFVYADVDGNIGYYAAGSLPIRKQGDGTLPVAGWTDANEWTGYVPFEQLPTAYNPPQGFIVTANNQVAPDSYPYRISTSWVPAYRAARIIELIQSKDRLSPDDMALIQADERSMQARALLPYLLKVSAPDEQARTAIAMLQGWDGTLGGESPQAAIYEAWYHQIPKRLFADELGADLWQEYQFYADYQAKALPTILEDPHSSWCDDVTTTATEDCATILAQALADGLTEMAQQQGTSTIADWHWDRVHQAIFPHQLFDNVDVIRSIFNRRVPSGGDDFTVNAGPVSADDLYNQYVVSSYRQIVNLGDLDSSSFILPGGQAGHILSRSYSDQLDRWRRDAYVPMRFTRGVDEDTVATTLTLEP